MIWSKRDRGGFFTPRVAIAKELYKKIESKAHDEDIPISKLVEKLLAEATKEKTMYCPRCAFKF